MRRKPAAERSIGIDRDQSVLDGLDCNYKTELHCTDAVQFLKTFDFTSAGRVLIYADPPYLQSTRTSRQKYKYEYSDEDHRALIDTLRSVPAKVILSGYESELYNELLADWYKLSFQIMTRGGPRTEVLWMNYQVDVTHWCTYAGKNASDRQRIKRKAERWADDYRAMPAAERQTILAYLLNTHVEG